MFWKYNPLTLLERADLLIFEGFISECHIKLIGDKWYGQILYRINSENNTELEVADKQKIVVMMQKNSFTAYNKQGIQLKVGFNGNIYE